MTENSKTLVSELHPKAESSSLRKASASTAGESHAGSAASACHPNATRAVGLSVPVARIQQQERGDDPLACLAMLSSKSLAEVTELAYSVGYPRHGPAYVPDEMLVVLALKSGGWVAKNYKEFDTFNQLPSIAIVYVDYCQAIDLGRTVLWLKHPKSQGHTTSKPQALAKSSASALPMTKPANLAGSSSTLDLGAGYVIDPAYWITPEQQIITGITSVHFEPMWYMELHLMNAKTGQSEKAR